jgi:histidyl-tRNA synthetase
LGKREEDEGVVSLKNLHTGEQKVLSVMDAIAEVKGFGDR